MSVLLTSGGGPSGALSGWACPLGSATKNPPYRPRSPAPLGPLSPPRGAAVVPTPAR